MPRAGELSLFVIGSGLSGPVDHVAAQQLISWQLRRYCFYGRCSCESGTPSFLFV